MNQPENITLLLKRWQAGDKAALNHLMPLVYQGLYDRAGSYMKSERRNHTLSSTALVNELFIRLVKEQDRTWQNRQHFFAIAATIMRHLLVHYADARNTKKRGSDVTVLQTDQLEDLPDIDTGFLLDFDAALEALKQKDPEMARLIEMRYLVGLTLEEMVGHTELSLATIKRHLKFSRAWIKKFLKRDEP